MFAAVIAYVAASAALIALEQRLARAAHTDPQLAWLNERIYTPLGRTLVLVLFIVLAYPAPLGLPAAPPLGEVLRDGNADRLITALFVASLALPLVPVVRAVPGAVLAGQGILACCLLTSWVADALGAGPVRYWMGVLVALEVAAILVAGRFAARGVLALYPGRLRSRYADIASEAARLLSEIPAIALYGWALGRQLQPFAAA